MAQCVQRHVALARVDEGRLVPVVDGPAVRRRRLGAPGVAAPPRLRAEEEPVVGLGTAVFSDLGEHVSEPWPDLDRAEALALRRLRGVAAAALLAVDADHALLDVEVAEPDVERFGDPGARTDQERRERPVMGGAGVEVGPDLIESEVVQLGSVDRQRRHRSARVATQKPATLGLVERDRQAGTGVVDGLRRQFARLDEGDHLVHPAPHQLLVNARERRGAQARQQPLAAVRRKVLERALRHIGPPLVEEPQPERLEGLAGDRDLAAFDRLHEAPAGGRRGSPAREPAPRRERPV